MFCLSKQEFGLALWQGEGQERGHCGRADEMDTIVATIFRNIIYHRTLSLGSLSPTLSQLNKNLWRNSKMLSGKSCVCVLLSTICSLALSVSYNMAFQCARRWVLPLLWAILIREIENNLSAVIFYSRTQSYFCKNSPSAPVYSDVEYYCFIITGEFLVRTVSSVFNLCVKHSITFQ